MAFLEKTRVSGELLEKIERAQQERLAGYGCCGKLG